MKRFARFIATLMTALTCLSVAYAQPTTFLGPTLKGGFTTNLSDTSAYSILGEAGIKNFRIGATYGMYLDENQRLKVSAEYLWQEISYSFITENATEWVRQGAVGAVYEYQFCGVELCPVFSLGAYASYAPSKNLGNNAAYINIRGVTTPIVNSRHIAGSRGFGLTPGVSVAPWCGARVGLDVNYDNVRYRTRYYNNSNDPVGLGTTLKYDQLLSDDVSLGLTAAFRKPFNNYQATLEWMNIPYYGVWALDLDAAYTAGKFHLPSTYNLSISANYFLDQRCPVTVKGYKGETKQVAIKDDLLQWTTDPAVYMPQVLAIPEERRVCSPAPSLIGFIPATVIEGPTTIPTAQAFSPSSGLTYSLTIVPPLTAGTATINPNTGVITADTNNTTDQPVAAIVTATNACGSATAATLLLFLEG